MQRKREMNKAREHVRRTKKRIRQALGVQRQYHHNLLETKRMTKWMLGRGYDHYNAYFREILGREIIDSLAARAKNLRRPLRVLDDGAGHGVFLAQLKEMAANRGIQLITTALALHLTPQLQKLKNENNISHITHADIQTFVPQQRQDFIFSLYGGFNYSTEVLKKDTLLKLAHSLSVNGIACIGFEAKRHLSYDTTEKIVIAFKKRGFAATFSKQPPRTHKHVDLPDTALMIRRLR